MCGRTTLFAPPGDVEERFDATFAYDYEPRYNIAPEGPGIPAIRDEDPDAIERLHWGLVPFWVDDRDDWYEPINARAESVPEKPTFRDAFRKRRCLVIADGFYEWSGAKGSRTPYRVVVDDGEPFGMAGLWETFEQDGEELVSTTIVTSDPNDTVGELHDRMPVVLEPDEEDTWLHADDEDALTGVFDPFPDERMDAYEVSTAVNNPRNEGPDLVEPVGSEQSGLDEFA